MGHADLSDLRKLLDTIPPARRHSMANVEPLARNVLRLSKPDLTKLAHKAYRRRYRWALDLIHAEFQRRRISAHHVATALDRQEMPNLTQAQA